MKKHLALLIVSVFMLLAGCGGGAQTSSGEGSNTEAAKIIKFATVSTKGQPITDAIYKFAELVEERSNGSIKVEVYTDGQLGNDLDVISGLKAGTIQASNISTAPLATTFPKLNAFDLPFLFEDYENAYQVLDGEIGDSILAEFPNEGLVGLGYWENGFRFLTNNTKEVKSVDDLAGMKIRTMENELHLDIWKQLDTNPTPLAFTELFTALEQKVVDGQENSLSNTRFNKFYEVQKYFTDTKHVYSPSIMLISDKFWKGLSSDEQQILQAASNEARDYQRELSQKNDQESITFLENEGGMQVTILTPEERQRFVDKVQPVYEKYSQILGEDFVQKLVEAAK